VDEDGIVGRELKYYGTSLREIFTGNYILQQPKKAVLRAFIWYWLKLRMGDESFT